MKNTGLAAMLLMASLSSTAALSADEALTPSDQKAEEHYLEGHSPADAKAMSKMKEKKMHTHKKGDPVPHDASDDGKEVSTMGHSPSDAKSMMLMKDKSAPQTHKIGEPVAHEKQPCTEVSTMGHSPADAKSMSKMKDKDAPQTTMVGDCEPKAAAEKN